MRFCSLVLILFTLASCSKKDITFDVIYELTADEFKIDNQQLVIKDFPLFLQNNVEKNYSKISLINEVNLVEICSDKNLKMNHIYILNQSNWDNIGGQIKNETPNCAFILDLEKNLKNILKADKLSLIIALQGEQEKFPKTLRLKFRFKGKHEKTNIQYRIVA